MERLSGRCSPRDGTSGSRRGSSCATENYREIIPRFAGLADEAAEVFRADHVTPADRCHTGWSPNDNQPLRYRAIDYRAVRQLISLSRVLSLLSFEPVQCRGDNLRGNCMLCARQPAAQSPRSRTSFAANLPRHIWYCFACRQGGDQLKLWSLSNQQPLYAATKLLCHSAGLAIPWLPSPQPSSSSKEQG